MKYRAWAAGFFDGEGTTTCNHGQLGLFVAQSEPTTLERFRNSIGGFGKVLGPYPSKTHCPMYYYKVYGEELNLVIRNLWPYLSEPKRNQIREAVKMSIEYPRTAGHHFSAVRNRVLDLSKVVA
jgi:hypothetical protein